MKKKYIFSIIAIILCIAVVGCGKKEESKIDYLVLVNKQNKLPDDWEEKVELVDVKTGLDETYKVEKKAAEAYQKLKEDLANDGVVIELDSTYRSVASQQELWDTWMVEYGEEYVRKYVAVPGYSEHHTGLALDIKLVVGDKVIYDNDEMIAEREIFAKIHAKLAKYGFILRYLENKDDITGYSYEPWHLRYIDDPEIAKEIMDKNLTLEEYLENK
jgi:D-alanyl-D-alanine carboxypeptidase